MSDFINKMCVYLVIVGGFFAISGIAAWVGQVQAL